MWEEVERETNDLTANVHWCCDSRVVGRQLARRLVYRMWVVMKDKGSCRYQGLGRLGKLRMPVEGVPFLDPFELPSRSLASRRTSPSNKDPLRTRSTTELRSDRRPLASSL